MGKRGGGEDEKMRKGRGKIYPIEWTKMVPIKWTVIK